MNTLEDRVAKAIRIADTVGNRDATDPPLSTTDLEVRIVTIGALLKGQWDVTFDNPSDDADFTIHNLMIPQPVR